MAMQKMLAINGFINLDQVPNITGTSTPHTITDTGLGFNENVMSWKAALHGEKRSVGNQVTYKCVGVSSTQTTVKTPSKKMLTVSFSYVSLTEGYSSH